jgi:hypothetical protein
MKAPEVISLVVAVLSLGFTIVTQLAKTDIFTLRIKCIGVKAVCLLVVVRCLIAIAGYFLSDTRLTTWFGATPMPFSSAICIGLLAVCVNWIVQMMEKQWSDHKEPKCES